MPTYAPTTATRKIAQTKRRIRLLAGGMRASKTISVLLYLIHAAGSDYECSACGTHGCLNQQHKKDRKFTMNPTLTSVVSESYPHLEKGAIRDFKSIMQSQHYWKDDRWNESKHIYTFETGSTMEFFSADQPGKVRGPSRDRLFVNEANNISQESWEQLLFRTRQFAFADWNPVGDFYLYEDYGLDDEKGATTSDDRVDFLILTYRDNEALEPAIIEDIERKAAVNANWARVYAEGKRGNMEGKIFNGWKIIDEIPHEARLEVRGLDFGYARDKTACCDIYRYNGGYIIDEVVSRVQLKDTDLAHLLLNQENPNTLTIGDSADIQKIHTLQEMGLNIIGVEKVKGASGQNFTNAAISFVQDQPISITKRSVNYIKSYRNFMWQTDKDGNVLPKYDHFMSDEMMSVVYGFTAFEPRQRETTEYSSGDLTELWV